MTVPASECSATSKVYPQNPYFKHCLKDANQTYIRILLNDVVYPLRNCQNGPGHSCLLSQYAGFIHEKNIAAGEFKDYCNFTTANAPTNINGARFFTDMTLDYLTFLKPFLE